MTIPTPNLGPGIVTSRVRDMTATEARLCVQRINSGMNETRKLLLELYDRKGWLALGYANWRECAVKEFGESASRLYQQLKAGQIEKEISTIVEIEVGTIPEGQLRGLDVATVRQAAAELEPHYEQHEDAGEPPAPPAEQIIARGVKEIIARAKELKAKLKTEKREARKQAVAANGKTFERVAMVGSVEIHCADSRNLHEFVPAGSVQLVVTSPPYNQRIEYDTHADDLPWTEYLSLLRDVFCECYAALCAGGTIAVVVPAGVGRKPWKRFASVVEKQLCLSGFSPRAEIVWYKGKQNGLTSWGTFRTSQNPSHRDCTERILIARKGDANLVVPAEYLFKDEAGTFTPFLASADEFMDLVWDHWFIVPASAQRIGHPAPFPVEIPERLIKLYAYPSATILDPFVGSGSTLLAAQKWGCKGIGFDIDAGYCALARGRCEKAQAAPALPDGTLYASDNILAEWFTEKDGSKSIKICRPESVVKGKPVLLTTRDADQALQICKSVDECGGDFGKAKRMGFGMKQAKKGAKQ